MDSKHHTHAAHKPHIHHGHVHGHSHDPVAQKNQEFWHSASSTVYDAQWVRDLQDQIKKHVSNNLGWFGAVSHHDAERETKMLDYACGNGLISQILSPYFTKIIGIDIAQGMVDSYNAKARALNLPASKIYAVQGDLMSPETTTTTRPTTNGGNGNGGVNPEFAWQENPEFSNFDLIVICLALHHISSPQDLLTKLVSRLRPGGRIVVMDWLADGELGEKGGFSELQGDDDDDDDDDDGDVEGKGKERAALRTCTRSGFSQREMDKLFKEAGCTDTDFVLHEERSILPLAASGDALLFYAKGTK